LLLISIVLLPAQTIDLTISSGISPNRVLQGRIQQPISKAAVERRLLFFKIVIPNKNAISF